MHNLLTRLVKIFEKKCKALPIIGSEATNSPLEEKPIKMPKVTKTSKNGIDIIKRFEGLRLKSYLCPANVWTIGYGTTDGVVSGQVITQEQAEDLLAKDLEKFEAGVLDMVEVKINQNQFDALVSFSYNVGLGALTSSTALRLLNKKDYVGAAEALTMWNKARVNGKLIILKGLVRRREAEKKLFLEVV